MSSKTRDVKSSLSPLKELRKFKNMYLAEGFELVGLFGSYAKESEDVFSDIDIAYTINHNIFFRDNAYKKLLRIEEIKKELEMNFHKKVDLVSLDSDNSQFNENINKELIKL